jgi:hypothetical protein
MFTIFKIILKLRYLCKNPLTRTRFCNDKQYCNQIKGQLPDATIRINSLDRACDSRKIDVNYTVFNRNSTNSIAAGMPTAVYANGSLLSTSKLLLPSQLMAAKTAALLYRYLKT